MRFFKLPGKVTKFNELNIPIINSIFNYIGEYFKQRIQAQEVTFSTNMNTDVSGDKGDIVRCSTDNKFYGCTVSGVVGSAIWVAFN